MINPISVSGATIPQAWRTGLAKIKIGGDIVTDQRGDIMSEILGLRLEITRPLHNPIPTGLPELPGVGVWRIAPPLEDYAFQLITGLNARPAGFSAVMAAQALRRGDLKKEDCIKPKTDEALRFEYTYGERVDFWGQLRYVEEILTTSSETRRARLIISRLGDLALESPPCWQLSEFFIRDGRLHQFVDIRSWCFSSAATENLYGWARLSEYLAGQIGAEVGPMIVNAGSAHIPKHDMWWVNRVLGAK